MWHAAVSSPLTEPFRNMWMTSGIWIRWFYLKRRFDKENEMKDKEIRSQPEAVGVFFFCHKIRHKRQMSRHEMQNTGTAVNSLYKIAK